MSANLSQPYCVDIVGILRVEVHQTFGIHIISKMFLMASSSICEM